MSISETFDLLVKVTLVLYEWIGHFGCLCDSDTSLVWAKVTLLMSVCVYFSVVWVNSTFSLSIWLWHFLRQPYRKHEARPGWGVTARCMCLRWWQWGLRRGTRPGQCCQRHEILHRKRHRWFVNLIDVSRWWLPVNLMDHVCELLVTYNSVWYKPLVTHKSDRWEPLMTHESVWCEPLVTHKSNRCEPLMTYKSNRCELHSDLIFPTIGIGAGVEYWSSERRIGRMLADDEGLGISVDRGLSALTDCADNCIVNTDLACEVSSVEVIECQDVMVVSFFSCSHQTEIRRPHAQAVKEDSLGQGPMVGGPMPPLAWNQESCSIYPRISIILHFFGSKILFSSSCQWPLQRTRAADNQWLQGIRVEGHVVGSQCSDIRNCLGCEKGGISELSIKLDLVLLFVERCEFQRILDLL